ncbi:hypothetical protein DsansV1_C04g0038591 [Dioscorea sansibarensis]
MPGMGRWSDRRSSCSHWIGLGIGVAETGSKGRVCECLLSFSSFFSSLRASIPVGH